ncbi:uncharacterized protein UTRI_01832_B [Ustilago trichophora]|uniref:Uncharacterized protein n=1 Tax=Ustilago trichophora TaxID=86804 RepID=A0A5C3E664_9BASI|nr:uncharacterized protein UTRI_01832_B [Ustilago trichophora]
MVAARRQKQAQKLQEQQMSRALAESKPSTSHVSFDDGEDDDADNAPQTATTSRSNVQTSKAESGDEDSEDDDAPIEVVSNKTSRKQASQDSAKIKAQEKAEKAKRQAAEKKRLDKQKEKEAAKAVQTSIAATEEVEEQATPSDSDKVGAEKEDEEDDAGPSNRLDPSLFAEVFAQPVAAPRSILKRRSAEERADEVAKLQRERKQRRKEQRAGGVVKGRDGLPMKKAEDGTVLRALNTSSKSHKTSFDDDDQQQPNEPLDSVIRPTPLDPSASLPSAKVRAFKKRTLVKKGAPTKTAPAKGPAKSKKSEDDPLGLNDPAFMPGGEFYHLLNKSDKRVKDPKQRDKGTPASARQAFRGGGVRKDAVSVLRARSRGGPSLGFARSQDDSDDGY